MAGRKMIADVGERILTALFNDPEGKDGYAMADEKFHSLYEPMDP